MDMAYTHWAPSHAASNPSTGGTNTLARPVGAVMVNNRRRDFRKMVLRDGLLTAVAPEPARPHSSYAVSAAAGTIAPPPPGVRVVLVDVATEGVGLRCRHELALGTCFSMTVPGHPEYDTPRLRVIRVRPGRGNEFEVGAEFC